MRCTEREPRCGRAVTRCESSVDNAVRTWTPQKQEQGGMRDGHVSCTLLHRGFPKIIILGARMLRSVPQKRGWEGLVGMVKDVRSMQTHAELAVK